VLQNFPAILLYIKFTTKNLVEPNLLEDLADLKLGSVNDSERSEELLTDSGRELRERSAGGANGLEKDLVRKRFCE
jgi:hypothetical protein